MIISLGQLISIFSLCPSLLLYSKPLAKVKQLSHKVQHSKGSVTSYWAQMAPRK